MVWCGLIALTTNKTNAIYFPLFPIRKYFNEITGRDVAFGTMETLKLMPGYKKALDKLVEKHNKAKEQIEEKKFETNVE